MFYWVLLFTAILLEVSGTISMKLSHGFTKIIPSILLFVFYAASFCVLTVVLKKIDVGTAYAVWSGFGTALIATIGIGYFGESVSFVKILSIVLIIIGVIGLNISGMRH